LSCAELEHAARIIALQQRLEALGIDALWVPPSGDTFYLLGIPLPRPAWGTRDPVAIGPDEGVLIGAGAPIVFAAHSVWGRAARTALAGRSDVVQRNTDDLSCALASLTLSLPPHATLEQYRALKLAGATVSGEACDEIAALRRLKSAWEVERLKNAQAICEAALDHAIFVTHVGMSVLDFRTALIDSLYHLGAEAVCSGPEIQVEGPNIHLPFSASTPGELAASGLEDGAVMTLNFGCMARGYLSDVGRTIYVGEPRPEALTMLHAARIAQAAGAAVLGSGGTGAAIAAAVRGSLAGSNIHDGVWPKAGHGIGIEHHEAPLNDDHAGMPYQSGMAATVEVGIWPREGFGAYCEDVVVCRNGGVDWLSRPDRILAII